MVTKTGVPAGPAPGNAPTTLSKQEVLRYSRHLIMPEVGMDGQLKLKQAKVLCIGTGGLGAPLGLYLAAAGVGRIGLVDFDSVDFTNLQRQVLFGTSDVGRPKIAAAADRLRNLNPEIQIDPFETRLTSENALELFQDYDIIVDGTDNFPTRYLVNDACVLLGKPNVYGSIFRFEGQVTVFGYPDGPCYRCLYPGAASAGTRAVVRGRRSAGRAAGNRRHDPGRRNLKADFRQGPSLSWAACCLFDALAMRFRELKLRKNPECPVCGEHRTVTKLIDYAEFCGIRGEEAPTTVTNVPEITPRELKSRLDRGDDLYIVDVREPHEYQICNLNGHLIPLGELSKRVHELDSSREIVAHCRTGKRSAEAVDFLRKAGFRKIWNLKGGILAWSDEVDSSVPKY